MKLCNKLMKKLLGILVLCLLLSGSAFAKTIYCYNSNESGSTERIGPVILFFEIDDRSKKVKWLKSYEELKNINTYEFYYYGDTSSSTSEKILKFNKNEILLYEDFKGKEKDMIDRNYLELDRISGLLLWTFGIQVDSEGNEISEDHKGTIYKRGDKKFNDHIFIEKYLCDNHKGL